MKKKLVYVTSIAAPHQLKLCGCLQDCFDTEFWFYDHIGENRPAWWKMDLPPYCKVLDNVFFKRSGRYFSLELNRKLEAFNPDIVMLGGFFIPSNYFAYRWAIRNSKKVIVFTETFRKKGKLSEKSLKSQLVDHAYRKLDAVFACHQDAASQLKQLLPILGKKTFVTRYAAAIDDYLVHPIRESKPAYNFIFPNRLTKDYNPLLAIEIFSEIAKRYPLSMLRINTQGELLPDCKKLIHKLDLDENVKFLSDIKHWNDLSEIYRNSDILLFPANFSNGNFTIIECMASGLGIIVSNKIYGLNTLISNSVNGFICEPTKEKFLDAVQKYLDNPDLLESHAKLNREIVRPLSGAGTAELYASIINEILIN